MKAQPSSGHIFYARSCVRRAYPSDAMEIVSYCTKSGHMSRKLGIGKKPFHHQVMSGDIDHIQDPRYRMSRRTSFNLLLYYVRGFAYTWMALRARNPSPKGTCHLEPPEHVPPAGHRPGPTLAPSVRGGSLRATEPRAREKTRGRKRKKCRYA